MPMKNKDALLKQKEESLLRMHKAVESSDEKEFAAVFVEHSNLIQETILQEARAEIDGLVQNMDNQILAGRGTRALTSKESAYYQKVIAAAKSSSPKQALTDIEDTLPETVIEAVFEDIREAHPLLSEIDFVNTGILTKYIYSVLDGRLMASWYPLCDEILKEVTAGFDTIDLTLKKLAAFLPVCKSMLEAGPVWLDRYVRAVLAEAIANGLEAAIIDGDGLVEPIGMRRDPNGILDPVTGRAELIPVPLARIDPVEYGALIADLAINRNGLHRDVPEVVFICNPIDKYTKVAPAIMYQNAEGAWVPRWPYPTKLIPSAFMPLGEAIIGIGRNYFMGVGIGGSGGRIDFSDHYRWLEDERVYLTKLIGNGQPKDSTSFILLDISNLEATINRVFVTNENFDVDILNQPIGVEIPNQPIQVASNDARLANLKIGNKALTPGFNKSVFNYEVSTTDATNTIAATPMDGEANVTIILNGTTPVTNGESATWASGENTLVVEVEIGGETEFYTVVVTKS